MKNFIIHTFITLLIISKSILAITHPHIIVKESEYAELQGRAVSEPWLTMKTKAMQGALTLVYDPNMEYEEKCWQAQDIASSISLAYILDPNNRAAYVNRVVTVLVPAMENLRYEKSINQEPDSDYHLYCVRPASTAFMVYITLDIMYNDLPANVRDSLEYDCDYIADNHIFTWLDSYWSIRGMKELYYNGITTTFDTIKNNYKNHILYNTSQDGVYNAGPGYAWSRLYVDYRIHKKIFMDVCEYQGYHEFYNNSVFKNLYEWYFGYGVTPFNRMYTFGDTPIVKMNDEWSASVIRARRFSDEAQQYAAYYIGPLTETQIKGHLLHYILCDAVPLDGVKPKSRVFQDGGAWLYDDTDTDRALAAAMWNTTIDRYSHTHKEVNGINMAAYGEIVLRHPGYSGYNEPSKDVYDDWITGNAESGNTVLIGDTDHSSRKGDGIISWLLGTDVEFACGHSGEALPAGLHLRNLIFVKPGVKNGYYILVDEIASPGPSYGANVVLHPNSESIPTVLSNYEDYNWTIEGCSYSNHQVYLKIFYGSIPTDVEIRTGYLGGFWSGCNVLENAKYAYSSYDTNDLGKAAIMTILFPFDDTHIAAPMTRIQLAGASGTEINHGDGIVDILMSSTGASEINYNNITFQGIICVSRELNNVNQFYFVKGANKFDGGAVPRKGFDSEMDISLFMKERTGKINSPGSNVTFYYPHINGLELNGIPLAVIDSGENWVTVNIPIGIHDIKLTQETVSLSGTAYYVSNGQPIKNVEISISTDPIMETSSEINGYYEFPEILTGYNYKTKATKLADSAIGFTISTYDAAMTARAAVGIIQLDENEFIAADVSRDGNVYTFDASLIAQYAIGLPKEPISHAGEWQFIPDSIVYPMLESNYSDQNFAGIIIGNVDGRWTQPDGQLEKEVVIKEYEKLKDISAQPGEKIIIPLEIDRNKEIIAAEIDLNYDSNVLDFIGVDKTSLSEKMQLLYNSEIGRLRVAAYTVEPINQSGVIIKLKFYVKIKHASISELCLNKFMLNNDMLFKATSKIFIGSESDKPTQFKLQQSYPNPFKPTQGFNSSSVNSTNIRYQLAQRKNVSLKIYNYLGQEIKTLVGSDHMPGSYNVFWDGKDNNGNFVIPGIYLYRIIAGDFVKTKRMIILK
jgi:hypothetical protein